MKQFENENQIVIVGEGGEILRQLSADQHKIISIAQIEAYKKKMEREKNKSGKKFVISVNERVKEVSKFMSLQESGAMFSIMVHLDFNSEGVIVKGGQPITMKDLEKLLGKSKTQVVRLVNSLEKLSLIFREKVGRSTIIKVNEEFHFIGKVLKKDYTTKVYTVKAKQTMKNLELNELGVLYKIMPFFHFEHMVLCSNPDERNPDKLGMLSLEELADKVGVDRTTLARIMPKLVRKNAVMKAENGRVTHYLVNPNLYFRMTVDTEITEVIRMLFDREEDNQDKEG